MTVLGLGARIPGLPTFVTNLIRRGTALAGMPKNVVAAKALPWWYLMLYGDTAKAAALATVQGPAEGTRMNGRTPIEEYSASIDQTLSEMDVTPGLVGRTFGAVARLAFLRYGVSVIAATVPINDDVTALVPGLPKTYRTFLFPADTTLQFGMKLYCITHRAEMLERFRVETGGPTRTALEKALETMQSAFVIGQGAAAAARTAERNRALAEERDMGAEAAAAGPREAAGAGTTGASGWVAGGQVTLFASNANYNHNMAAITDLAVPWCFVEADEIAAAESALLHKLHLDRIPAHMHIPAFNRAGHRTAGSCESCSRAATAPHAISLLTGDGVVTLPHVATAAVAHPSRSTSVAATAAAPAPAPAPTVSSDEFSFDAPAPAPAPLPPAAAVEEGAASADGAGGAVAVGPTSATPASSVTANPLAVAAAAPVAVVAPAAVAVDPLSTRPIVVPRRVSLGDDGLGGMDDTDDVSGPDGPLLTVAPHFSATTGIAATARAAARANTNALAVRLALPVTAVSDVESMAADALDAMASAKYSGHVLICGVSDSMGYLLRAVAAMVSRSAADSAATPAAGSGSDASEEGDQYSFKATDIVVLAQSKPADAAMNAMYPGR